MTIGLTDTAFLVNAGTISASGGTVTGAGTAWLIEGVRAGDVFIAGQRFAAIQEVISNTEMTVLPAPGTLAALTPYVIVRMPGDSAELSALTRELLSRFGAALFASSVVPAGAWSSATVYARGAIVVFNGTSYLAKRVNTNASPPTSPDDWQVMAVRGTEVELGANATHLQWRLVGAATWTNLIAIASLPAGPTGPESWATPIPFAAGISASSVAPRTTVVHLGETYVCTTSHTTTSTFAPANWIKVAERGTDGATGSAVLFTVQTLTGPQQQQARQNIGAPEIDAARRVDGKGLWWDAVNSRHIYAWASPLDATIDLRDLLDEQHGVGGWTQRTGVNTGTNCTVALTLGLDRLRARYGRGRILIPPGAWLFNTNIDPAKLSGIVLEGVHQLASQLIWAGGAANFLAWTGASAWSGGGIRKMGIYREDGFSAAAIAIVASGDATFQPDEFGLEDIYMSSLGSGFWQHNLFLSGQSRTSPQGLRGVNAKNLQLFRSGSASGYGIGIFNVVQGYFSNIGTYAGTGSLGTNIYVGGGGAPNTNTTQFTMDRLACGGELNLTNQSRSEYRGFCSLLAMAATADFVEGWIDASSTAGAVGPNSNLTIR